MKNLTLVIILSALCFFESQGFILSQKNGRLRKSRNEPKEIEVETSPKAVEDVLLTKVYTLTTESPTTPTITPISSIAEDIIVEAKQTITTTSTTSDLDRNTQTTPTTNDDKKEQKQIISKTSDAKTEENSEESKLSPREERKKKLCDYCKNGPKCKKFGDCSRCSLICQIDEKVSKRKIRSPSLKKRSHRVNIPEVERDTTLITGPDEETVLMARPKEGDDKAKYYLAGALNPGTAFSVLLKMLKMDQNTDINQAVVLVKSTKPVKTPAMNMEQVEDPFLDILSKQLSRTSKKGVNLSVDDINKALKRSLELFDSEMVAEETPIIEEQSSDIPIEEQTVGCSKEETEIVPFYPIRNPYNMKPKPEKKHKITTNEDSINEDEYEERNNKNPDVLEDLPHFGNRYSTNDENVGEGRKTNPIQRDGIPKHQNRFNGESELKSLKEDKKSNSLEDEEQNDNKRTHHKKKGKKGYDNKYNYRTNERDDNQSGDNKDDFVDTSSRAHHKKNKKDDRYRDNNEEVESPLRSEVMPAETVGFEWQPDHIITLQSRYSDEDNNKGNDINVKGPTVQTVMLNDNENSREKNELPKHQYSQESKESVEVPVLQEQLGAVAPPKNVILVNEDKSANEYPQITKIKSPMIEILPQNDVPRGAAAMREANAFIIPPKQEEEEKPAIDEVAIKKLPNPATDLSRKIKQFSQSMMGTRKRPPILNISDSSREENVENVNQATLTGNSDFLDGSKVEFQAPIIAEARPNLEMVATPEVLDPIENYPQLDQQVVGEPLSTRSENDIPVENIITPQEEQLLNNFGQIVPAIKKLDLHSGSDVFFMGNGIKLPLRVMQNTDGTISLTVDIDKLCQCKNISCAHKDEIAETLSKNIVGAHIVDDKVHDTLPNRESLMELRRRKRKHSKKLHKRSIEGPINFDLRPLKNGQIMVTKSNDLVKDKDNKKLNKHKVTNSDEELNELIRVRDIIKFKQIQRDLEDRLHTLNEQLDKSTKQQNEMLEEGTKTLLGIEGEDKIIKQRINIINDVLAWMKDLAVPEWI